MTVRIAMLLDCLLLCGAEQPKFEVTNKCPPAFAVTNRMPLCPCGEACSCPPGACPAQCPSTSADVQPKAAGVPVAVPAAVYTWIGNDRFGRPIYRVCNGNSCTIQRSP